MNPGITAYIAITIAAILIWSGWGSLLCGGFSSRGAGRFLFCWLIGSLAVWRIDGAQGTLVYCALFLLIIAVLASRTQKLQWSEKLSLLSYGLLLGAVYSLMELIRMVDPYMLAVHPALSPQLVVASLAVIYSRQGRIQLAQISLALIAKDIYLAVLHREQAVPVLGGGVFQDQWWIAAASARTLTLSLALIGFCFFGTLRRFAWFGRNRK
jgi:hypothetical protein